MTFKMYESQETSPDASVREPLKNGKPWLLGLWKPKNSAEGTVTPSTSEKDGSRPWYKMKRFLAVIFVGFIVAVVLAITLPVVLTRHGGKPQAEKGNPDDGPNIVMILTDDQDLHMDSLEHMPLLKQHIRDKGTEFRRHFCTVSICCPSRVTLWTGQHAHNHGVTDVVGHWGGWPRFKQRGLNNKYLPVWLQDSGYATYYTGKLFNAHDVSNYKDPYPAGWSASDFLLDPSTYQYNFPFFQRNAPDATGKMIHYGIEKPAQNGTKVYSTKLIQEKGYGFLQDGIKNWKQNNKPFFLAMAPIAPHADFSTGSFLAPKWEQDSDYDQFNNTVVPRVDWFNPDQPTGVSWTYQLEKLNQGNVTYMDEFYRARLAALQSVDRMVANITQAIEDAGIANNTYIIYTTDNGYHVGQHRMQPGKNCPFETDINIPLIIRGPGVKENHVSESVSSHVDMAPMIFNMIGRTPDGLFDGKSINYKTDIDTSTISDHVNVEFWGDWRPEGKLGQLRTPWAMNISKALESATYKALRVIGDGYDVFYSAWCTKDGNEHELYDMTNDTMQMNNLLRGPAGKLLSSDDALLATRKVKNGTYTVSNLWKRLDALMFVLKTCKGDVCRNPWPVLLPNANVNTLEDAMKYNDTFFDAQWRNSKVQFQKVDGKCIEGPVLDTKMDNGTQLWQGELPIFGSMAPAGSQNFLLVREDGTSWSDWT
jgi:N-acetylglucosamine-6-sulfatase